MNYTQRPTLAQRPNEKDQDMTEREAFEAYAADSIPDYQSPKPYTAAGVESNVRAEAWAAWQAACAWQREQILAMLPGGYSVDPQWMADEIRAQGER